MKHKWSVMTPRERDALAEEEQKLQPFRDAERVAWLKHSNLSTRLHVWWAWYRTAGGR